MIKHLLINNIYQECVNKKLFFWFFRLLFLSFFAFFRVFPIYFSLIFRLFFRVFSLNLTPKKSRKTRVLTDDASGATRRSLQISNSSFFTISQDEYVYTSGVN